MKIITRTNCLIALLCLNISAISQQQTVVQNQQNPMVSIGDASFSFSVAGEVNFTETDFKSNTQDMSGLSAIPWMVKVGGKTLTPKGYRMEPSRKSTSALSSQVIFTGELKEFTWKLLYEVSGPGRVTKTLSVTPKQDLQLDIVTLWDAQSTLNPVVSRTSLQDIACFYRKGEAGMFISLDFPYSRISVEQGVTEVYYPPFEKLKKGNTYTSHSLTLGATEVTGILRYGFYEGEVAAMDAYIQERFTPRFERPMFLSASIFNLYTQPRGDIIFYTMKNHPSLSYNKDLLRRELTLVPKLGMEYYQVFPGIFDWAANDPVPDTVVNLMDFARSQGVRMGDYSGTSEVFCAHYNNHRKHLDKPEWLIKSREGKNSGSFCFGHKEFVDMYVKTVTESARRYQFEIHCLDFLNIQPCYASSHGHPAGTHSVYRQVAGLARVLEGLNAVSPQMMTWSNSGNWAEFLPKIAWMNQNLYLTDPYIDEPMQGLNMTRLLDDARRKQMVSLHYSRFIPYRYLTNCQYFFSQNSIVPDLRNYQFGALSTLAVTPNLTLGEVRPWIDKQSPENQQKIIDFYKKWTGFIQKNFDSWKKTFHAGDEPGVESVEIYSHAEKGQGFVFIVNSSYSDRTVNVPMDERLGFHGQNQSELLELYPNELKRLTEQGPFFKLGSELPVHVPARQVLVLEVRPAPELITEPTLYGVTGSVEKKGEGYLLKTKGMQGQSSKMALLLPEGSKLVTSGLVRIDVPKQMERQIYPTPLKLVGSESKKGYQGLLMDIQFRREAVPTELRNWQFKAGSFEDGLQSRLDTGFSTTDAQLPATVFPLLTNTREFSGLPITDKLLDSLKLGALANFRGAYIENAFGEEQDTWIELNTGNVATSLPGGILSSGEVSEGSRELHTIARADGKSWWLQSEFNLPFMYTIGAEPAFDEHTILVLPLLRQHEIKDIRAWVNGKPLNVQAYKYPRNRGLATFFADLVGTATHGGKNRLVVHLQY